MQVQEPNLSDPNQGMINQSVTETSPSKQALQSLYSALPEEIETGASQQLELRREATRDVLARRMLILLGVSLILSFSILGPCVFIESSDKETAKDLVALILSSQTGLVGTVLGFYFGSQK